MTLYVVRLTCINDTSAVGYLYRHRIVWLTRATEFECPVKANAFMECWLDTYERRLTWHGEVVEKQ